MSGVDDSHEGAGDGIAGTVGSGGMAGGVFGVAVEPARRDPLGDFAVRHQPGVDDLRTGLEMELNAVGSAADAEALVGHHGAGHEVHGIVGQGERVDVPMEAVELRADLGEQRIGRALRGDVERRPGELAGAVQVVLAAVGAREQLGAQAAS